MVPEIGTQVRSYDIDLYIISENVKLELLQKFLQHGFARQKSVATTCQFYSKFGSPRIDQLIYVLGQIVKCIIVQFGWNSWGTNTSTNIEQLLNSVPKIWPNSNSIHPKYDHL